MAALNQMRGMLIAGNPKLPEKYSAEKLGMRKKLSFTEVLGFCRVFHGFSRVFHGFSRGFHGFSRVLWGFLAEKNIPRQAFISSLCLHF